MEKQQESLEEVVEKKVAPMIEESMEKNWGVVIPKIEEDITDKLKKENLDTFIHFNSPFAEAKRWFKKSFIERELARHAGNISQLAKFIGLDRRSIHRAIRELGIEMRKAKSREEKEEIQESVEAREVTNTIRSTLEQYKNLLQGDMIEKIYQELPRLSKDIATQLPHKEMTWKQAESHFEKEFLSYHYQTEQGRVKRIAEKIKLRPETVSRKLHKLGIK